MKVNGSYAGKPLAVKSDPFDTERIMALAGNGKVLIAYCFGQTTFTPQFGHCLDRLRRRSAGRVVDVIHHEISGVHIPKARNENVKGFLNHPKKPEWLLMVDTDATFAEDMLEQMIEVAHPLDRPIISALAFGVSDSKEGKNAVLSTDTVLFPTIYLMDDELTWRLVFDYPRDTLVPVAATGAHALLIHRRVLEDERWQEGKPLHPWFRVATMNDAEVSEDFFFCIRSNAFGYPIHVATQIKTGHVKTFVADEDEYDRRRYARQHWLHVPPPALEAVDVIVPVLNRPANVVPFLQSLRATTGLARAFFIVDRDDLAEREALFDAMEAGYPVWMIEAEGSTFAQKVNVGYRHTSAPWVFIVGDDVRFHPGWLDHLQAAAAETGAEVIGSNDLATARVMNGQHATHMMIRRDYIDTRGASWDGPGLIAHEGYHHWFVDDEICTAAKLLELTEKPTRRHFVSVPTAVVEHLHPLVGKAEVDDTYRLGELHSEADGELFVARYHAHVPEEVLRESAMA